jgi:TnsA endonuclease N terminal
MEMPVRKVSNWGGNIIGSFPSLKMKPSVKYESTIERDFLYFLEYDSTVVKYHAQPMVITATDTEGKAHTYTPDFQVVRTDRKEIIECKPEELLDQPHTQQQIRMGEAWADANNHYFVIVTDTDLRKNSTLANIKLLWRYSRLAIPTAIMASCIAHLKTQLEGITFEDLARFLTSIADVPEMQQPYRQAPFIYSMLFRHILKVDLTKPIISTSILWLSSLQYQEVK